jgi:sugar phosphate isomerase/epimerase
MDLGMPTLIETSGAADCAALCGALGLQFVELNMNLPEYQLGRIDADEFAALARRHGIYYTLHLDEGLNVCDFNPAVARAYLDTVSGAIALAKRLRIPVLNMHLASGVYFTLPDRKVYLFDRYEELYLQSLLRLRALCEREIGGAEIAVCVENTGGWNMPFLRKGLSLLLESPAFALTFDIGHNAASGGGDEAVILQYADKLRHMHLHDARGAQDHLPLGEGALDLRRYFRMAEARGCRAVLETKTVEGLRRSAEWVRGNIL